MLLPWLRPAVLGKFVSRKRGPVAASRGRHARPGERRIRPRLEILETRPSRSKPDRGMMITLMRILNQNGEEVMSFKGMQLTRRRPE